MIDMWLDMNQCKRDEHNGIYYVGGKKPLYLGQYTGHRIEDGTLHIDITVRPEADLSFINIKATVTKDGVKIE
tara:strand:+ start:262 stop:480 length:219 start_codon:yes stop_codon:yes gene_type:complete